MTPEHLLDLCRGASDAGPNGTRGALIAACSPERIAALAELWKAAAETAETLKRIERILSHVELRVSDIIADDDLCEAVGLNPWCVNEGLAEGHEGHSCVHIASGALNRLNESLATLAKLTEEK